MQHEQQERAPKGGIVSPLNGEFYEGGQFLATSPLPKAGKRRIKRIVAEQRNIASIVIRPVSAINPVRAIRDEACCVVYRAGDWRGSSEFFGTNDDCRAFADELIKAAAADKRSRGFQPHPTRLEVEIS